MSTKAHSQPFVSWEEAANLRDFGRTFFPLCGMILLKPAEFFRQLRFLASPQPPRRIFKALLFAVILGYVKLFMDVANIFWIQRLAHIFFQPQERVEISLFSTAVAGSAFFFLRPIIMFAATLAVVAVAVKLILGLDKPFKPVILIVSYRSAAELFHAIPFVGGIFALTWSLAILVIGVREAYGTSILRAFVAAIVMPGFLFFSVFLAVGGPSLSRVVMALYPEAQVHVRKINDLTAYVTTASVAAAAEAYKKELGFYPPHLEALQKYLTETGVARRTGGYVYDYRRLDDARFILEVRPVKMHESGRFVFYVDETGHVRLGGAEGRWIRNLKDLEEEPAGVHGEEFQAE